MSTDTETDLHLRSRKVYVASSWHHTDLVADAGRREAGILQ